MAGGEGRRWNNPARLREKSICAREAETARAPHHFEFSLLRCSILFA